MSADVGWVASVLALTMAVAQVAAATLGAAREHPALMRATTLAALVQFGLLLVAFGALAYAFVASDFTVLNVARNSNSRLPLPYRFAATWGSHEGSLLLWCLILSVWTAAVTRFTRTVTDDMRARALGVLGAISAGFLLFMLATSSPFVRLPAAPPDGLDLNPALQDPAMVLHPPLLYMGYVGFSVTFAFAVAALLAGRLDATWARWSRPWTTTAWTFLTCGIALGSFWAYYELGWGGWWFWDPVENASFVPWLVGTALMHSLAVTETRGAFRSWTVLLAIATFSLSLLGAFLVRSGVLTSVHAFATDPQRGVFLLVFLVLVVGGSLALYAARARAEAPTVAFGAISRESLLLSNNLLLTVAAASVLLGTLYPLVIDALGRGKLSVGPPYFNTVFVAIVAPALFLMGVGPLARWKVSRLPELARRLKWAMAVSVVAACMVPVVAGRWRPLVGLGVLLAVWIAASSGSSLLRPAFTERSWPGRLTGLLSRPLRFYGMHLAHLGVAVSVVGITAVTGFETERDVGMGVGDQVGVGGYGIRFDGIDKVEGANYLAARADIHILDDGRFVRAVHPERRLYYASQAAMTEAAIDAGIFRHIYVSLGEPLGGGAWHVRIQHKPFVGWIWAGAALMALGGVLAGCDRRSRRDAGGGVDR